jgi:hypothetical protein
MSTAVLFATLACVMPPRALTVLSSALCCFAIFATFSARQIIWVVESSRHTWLGTHSHHCCLHSPRRYTPTFSLTTDRLDEICCSRCTTFTSPSHVCNHVLRCSPAMRLRWFQGPCDTPAIELTTRLVCCRPMRAAP